MKLTWLGHACFLLEQDGYRIVIDPYTDVEGYPELRVQAHEVLCSHQHFDHNAVGRVTMLPERESPFTIRTVETCHDDQGGTLRGPNTIHVLTAGGVTVAHLGDLGHQLTREQLEAIGKVDGLLVPIGDIYTVDAAGAKQVCDAIHPKWVIPMHYHHAPYDFSNLSGVDEFLNLWTDAVRLEGAELEITEETKGVTVPTFV